MKPHRTNIDILRVVHFCMVAFCISGCVTGRGHVHNRSLSDSPEDLSATLHVFERIVKDPVVHVEGNRSNLSIDGPGIQAVVAMGTNALPHLLRIMKCEQLCFDTFARSYACCQQILLNADPKTSSGWHGDFDVEFDKAPFDIRIKPGCQRVMPNFRRRIIGHLVDTCGQLGIRVGDAAGILNRASQTSEKERSQ